MKFSIFRKNKYYCIIHGFPWSHWLCVKGKNHKSVFFWLHSHALSRNFTPHLRPTHSYMFSPLPHPYSLLKTGKKPLENQEDTLQVLWDLGLMATTCLQFLFFLCRACLGQWPSEAWCLPVLPKVWLGARSTHAQAVSGQQEGAVFQRCWSQGCDLPRCCQSCWHWDCWHIAIKFFSFSLVLFIKDPCCKVQTRVHFGPGLDNFCDIYCWAHNLANCLHWPYYPWIKFCATLFTLDDLFQETSWCLCLIKFPEVLSPFCLAFSVNST